MLAAYRLKFLKKRLDKFKDDVSVIQKLTRCSINSAKQLKILIDLDLMAFILTSLLIKQKYFFDNIDDHARSFLFRRYSSIMAISFYSGFLLDF